ncbi:MAG: hypothetical protein QGH99_05540 [Pseudomonadales bacterium]|jgi:hypothetical protein|nr:hypothetical protein [Pseudomonadales bacterium]MDP6316666.1 hypothetical protein [Pseudomonadales bacterium]MDP7576408.1 hypothetical protein [Pseudomonadales bacterium]HJP50631.1 hypothetical protein [Pseudomonadales bacterium]
MSGHSELAMKAAKRMTRTRHKEKTGHIVCQHLLGMLAEEPEFRQCQRATRRGWVGSLAVNTERECQYSLSF